MKLGATETTASENLFFGFADLPAASGILGFEQQNVHNQQI